MIRELDVVTTKTRKGGWSGGGSPAIVPMGERGTVVRRTGNWCEVEFVNPRTGVPWAFAEYEEWELVT